VLLGVIGVHTGVGRPSPELCELCGRLDRHSLRSRDYSSDRVQPNVVLEHGPHGTGAIIDRAAEPGFPAEFLDLKND
jgi:hypothetical protein